MKTLLGAAVAVSLILGGAEHGAVLTPAAVEAVNAERLTMEDQVYTLAAWHVLEGREEEFVAAWQELGDIFASLPHPPVGKGTLVQSTAEPTLFYSFGPWSSLDHVAAMREDPRARAGIETLIALCSDATPGAFRRVAESG